MLYKKIDDILWFDEDPIGITDITPRYEYQSYIHEIFGLVRANADRQEISDRFYKPENVTIGMSGKIENCLKIAVNIINVK